MEGVEKMSDVEAMKWIDNPHRELERIRAESRKAIARNSED
jgi:hypothetical protein